MPLPPQMPRLPPRLPPGMPPPGMISPQPGMGLPPQMPPPGMGMPPGLGGMPPGMPSPPQGMAPAGYGDDASGSGQGLDTCPVCGAPLPQSFNSGSAPNQPVKAGTNPQVDQEVEELLAALLGSGQGMGVPGGGYGG